MTEAAKVKAGITPAKPRAKRMMKDAMIQELEARIAQLEKPADWHPSKEPLVCISPLSLACAWPDPFLSLLGVGVQGVMGQQLTPTVTRTPRSAESVPDSLTTNGM